MRIYDPKQAIDQKAVIKAAIFSHAEQVAAEMMELQSLDLSEYGIYLQAEDFSMERSGKWTKRNTTAYREEFIILAGLWRSIDVRLRNKARNFINRL